MDINRVPRLFYFQTDELQRQSSKSLNLIPDFMSSVRALSFPRNIQNRMAEYSLSNDLEIM